MPDGDDKFKSRVSFTLLAITAIALAIGLVWIGRVTFLLLFAAIICSVLLTTMSGWVAACGALAVAALPPLSQWNTLLAVPVHATFGAQYRPDRLLIGCLAVLILPSIPFSFALGTRGCC
jgi:hypothetical protein